MSAGLRVADVIGSCWEAYNRAHRLPPHVVKAVRHILECRTAALGGHLYRCERCGSELPLYNSCLDRHCPTCQTVKKQDWLQQRRAELLPVQYFHSVFTLPHGLNGLVEANRRLLLDELFSVVNWLLQRFAADPRWRLQGQLGFLALLHTWNQRLGTHFHLHCIVPGGVWREASGQWVGCRRNFLFGKQALADAFRNRYLHRLVALRKQGKLLFSGPAAELADAVAWHELLSKLAGKRWAVWPKPTAAGAEQALDYLGRYAYRVAISDHRIRAIANGAVSFSWCDRTQGHELRTHTLPVAEFLARFLVHILPEGFHKIRFYGWLSPSKKKASLAAIREALGAPQPDRPSQESTAERVLRLTGVDIRQCPHCGQSVLVYVGKLPPACPRAPP